MIYKYMFRADNDFVNVPSDATTSATHLNSTLNHTTQHKQPKRQTGGPPLTATGEYGELGMYWNLLQGSAQNAGNSLDARCSNNLICNFVFFVIICNLD